MIEKIFNITINRYQQTFWPVTIRHPWIDKIRWEREWERKRWGRILSILCANLLY